MACATRGSSAGSWKTIFISVRPPEEWGKENLKKMTVTAQVAVLERKEKKQW
jgi:hypothetical protein